MKLLAIDTSSGQCSVGILDISNQTMVGEVSHDIGRGHAEVLMSQIDECMDAANETFSDITKLAVSTGPGSFTGVRVGMAAARGLALALDVPLVGIDTLSAAEKTVRDAGFEGAVAVILDAKRDQAYVKIDGGDPAVVSYEILQNTLQNFDGGICGSGAPKISNNLDGNVELLNDREASPIVSYAVLAAERDEIVSAPEPLYLRSADAKVQSGFALPREGG